MDKKPKATEKQAGDILMFLAGQAASSVEKSIPKNAGSTDGILLPVGVAQILVDGLREALKRLTENKMIDLQYAAGAIVEAGMELSTRSIPDETKH